MCVCLHCPCPTQFTLTRDLPAHSHTQTLHLVFPPSLALQEQGCPQPGQCIGAEPRLGKCTLSMAESACSAASAAVSVLRDGPWNVQQLSAQVPAIVQYLREEPSSQRLYMLRHWDILHIFCAAVSRPDLHPGAVAVILSALHDVVLMVTDDLDDGQLLSSASGNTHGIEPSSIVTAAHAVAVAMSARTASVEHAASAITCAWLLVLTLVSRCSMPVPCFVSAAACDAMAAALKAVADLPARQRGTPHIAAATASVAACISAMCGLSTDAADAMIGAHILQALLPHVPIPAQRAWPVEQMAHAGVSVAAVQALHAVLSCCSIAVAPPASGVQRLLDVLQSQLPQAFTSALAVGVDGDASPAIALRRWLALELLLSKLVRSTPLGTGSDMAREGVRLAMQLGLQATQDLHGAAFDEDAQVAALTELHQLMSVTTVARACHAHERGSWIDPDDMPATQAQLMAAAARFAIAFGAGGQGMRGILRACSSIDEDVLCAAVLALESLLMPSVHLDADADAVTLPASAVALQLGCVDYLTACVSDYNMAIRSAALQCLISLTHLGAPSAHHGYVATQVAADLVQRVCKPAMLKQLVDVLRSWPSPDSSAGLVASAAALLAQLLRLGPHPAAACAEAGLYEAALAASMRFSRFLYLASKQLQARRRKAGGTSAGGSSTLDAGAAEGKLDDLPSDTSRLGSSRVRRRSSASGSVVRRSAACLSPQLLPSLSDASSDSWSSVGPDASSGDITLLPDTVLEEGLSAAQLARATAAAVTAAQRCPVQDLEAALTQCIVASANVVWGVKGALSEDSMAAGIRWALRALAGQLLNIEYTEPLSAACNLAQHLSAHASERKPRAGCFGPDTALPPLAAFSTPEPELASSNSRAGEPASLLSMTAVLARRGMVLSVRASPGRQRSGLHQPAAAAATLLANILLAMDIAGLPRPVVQLAGLRTLCAGLAAHSHELAAACACCLAWALQHQPVPPDPPARWPAYYTRVISEPTVDLSRAVLDALHSALNASQQPLALPAFVPAWALPGAAITSFAPENAMECSADSEPSDSVDLQVVEQLLAVDEHAASAASGRVGGYTQLHELLVCVEAMASRGGRELALSERWWASACRVILRACSGAGKPQLAVRVARAVTKLSKSLVTSALASPACCQHVLCLFALLAATVSDRDDDIASAEAFKALQAHGTTATMCLLATLAHATGAVCGDAELQLAALSAWTGAALRDVAFKPARASAQMAFVRQAAAVLNGLVVAADHAVAAALVSRSSIQLCVSWAVAMLRTSVMPIDIMLTAVQCLANMLCNERILQGVLEQGDQLGLVKALGDVMARMQSDDTDSVPEVLGAAIAVLCDALQPLLQRDRACCTAVAVAGPERGAWLHAALFYSTMPSSATMGAAELVVLVAETACEMLRRAGISGEAPAPEFAQLIASVQAAAPQLEELAEAWEGPASAIGARTLQALQTLDDAARGEHTAGRGLALAR